MSEYQALLLAENLRGFERSARKAWEDYFVHGEVRLTGPRSVILESWQRCRSDGVDPLLRGPRVVSTAELEQARALRADLVDIARPLMERTVDLLHGSGSLVILCDERGLHLEVRGDPETLYAARAASHIEEGACYGEHGAGTNAVGTAIALNRPIQVTAAEHYCEGIHPWTCSAVPIRDPETGHMVGVFDITSRKELVHPHSLGLAAAAVNAIESQLALSQDLRRARVTDRYFAKIQRYPTDAVLAVSQTGRLIRANETVLTVLGLRNGDQGSYPVTSPEVNDWLKRLMNGAGRGANPVDPPASSQRRVREVAVEWVRDEGLVIGALVVLQLAPALQGSNHSAALSGRPAPEDSSTKTADPFAAVIGSHFRSLPVFRDAQRAARVDVPVLLEGESGVGKDVFAQAIHRSSSRRHGPFIIVNCGALPPSLIAGELFGHSEGAYTGSRRGGAPGKFEMADGGTLFLDEIGEMPLEAQATLLRVLQDGSVTRLGANRSTSVNVRILAATNRDLTSEVKVGNFRLDLYYRMKVLSLHLPPLRERKSDVLELSTRLLEQITAKYNLGLLHLDPQCETALQLYKWPGNIRELYHVLERAAIVCDGNMIHLEHLPEEIRSSVPGFDLVTLSVTETAALSPIEQSERAVILSTLARTGGVISEVARQLGIGRNTLYRKLRRYRIQS